MAGARHTASSPSPIPFLLVWGLVVLSASAFIAFRIACGGPCSGPGSQAAAAGVGPVAVRPATAPQQAAVAPARPTVEGPVAGVGTVTVPSGTVSLETVAHTEPPEPTREQVRRRWRSDAASTAALGNQALLLDLRLRNSSRSPVTVERLAVLSLGRFERNTDLDVEAHIEVDGQRVLQPLGDVCAALVGDIPGAETTTDEDLLPSPRDPLIVSPGQSARFRLRVVCRDANFGAPGDFGTFDGLSLAALDEHGPYVEAVLHLVVPAADVRTDRGTVCRLYSTEVCGLEPVRNHGLVVMLRETRSGGSGPVSPLDLAFSRSAAETATFLANWGVRTHAETVAFACARKEGRVPAGFDPEQVAEFSYHGDAGSPFRSSTTAAAGRGGAEPSVLWGKEPLSNAVAVLSAMRTAHPLLWEPMRNALTGLAGDQGARPLNRKARYLLAHMEAAASASQEPAE